MERFMNKTSFLFAILMIMSSALSYAQEVPAESADKNFKFCDIFAYEHPEKKGDDEKKWNLNLAGSYIRIKGNTDSLDTTYSASFAFDNNITSFRAAFNGAYGKTSGIKDENNGTFTAGFDWYMFWRIEFFSYTMSDYDEITLLEHRNDSGAGLKFVFVHNKYLLVDISGAPVMQYEKYEDMDKVTDWRWSVRGRIEIFPDNTDFRIHYYTFYVQKMDNTGNYRTIHDIYMYMKIIGVLGIKAGYRREYDTYTKEYLELYPLTKKTDEKYYLQASVSL